MEATRAISLAALSPARLQALAAEAWPLLPVPPDERKHLLRDEAAKLVDRLLVEVARGSGAIAVAMGEGMASLCSGDGTMRLGYSGIADYARENLSIAERTALDMMKLARDLRSRPLLREAVRSGEISTEKARAILPKAVSDAEAEWVARARRETVRALKGTVGGGKSAEEREPWERMRLEVPPPDRKDVDEALELAGKKLGRASPRWQRVEAVSQEYLGGHPVEPIEDPPPDEHQGVIDAFDARLRPATALDAWLEAETDRWSFLHQAEAVPAPDAGVDDTDRAQRIDARLRELAAMHRGWDELVGHLSLLVVNTGLWRDMGFASVDHYAAERLGMSGRTMEQRAWLERRMWDLPAIRKAMRDGRIGYEKARWVARCHDPEFVEGWIDMAEEMTCIELKRAVEADEERQVSARNELELVMPRQVSALFHDACRAVRAAEKRHVTTAEALVIMSRHFIDTYKEELKERNTPAKRARDRDRGWCTAPGCSRPAANSHHIRFRSHGGGDGPPNRTSLCLAHHLHGVHKGYIRVRGRAPDDLVWELGEVG
jgi:hypothetical protein